MDTMGVFNTYLYEVSKGTKPVALVTFETGFLDNAIRKLEKRGLKFLVQTIDNSKANLFFGKKECIDAIKTFIKPLNDLNPYEDFILGAVLGYDTAMQCERFLNMLNKTCTQAV